MALLSGRHIQGTSRAGVILLPAVALLFFMSTGIALTADMWLKNWSELPQKEQQSNLGYLNVYVILTISLFVIGFVRTVLFFSATL